MNIMYLSYSVIYLQISYGASNPSLENKAVFPTFFQMAQNDFVIYSHMAQMLKYFGWSWIGIITSSDDSGKEEARLLNNILDLYQICVVIMLLVGGRLHQKEIAKQVYFNKKIPVNVFVLCGTFDFVPDFLDHIGGYFDGKTIILNPTWAANIAMIAKHPEFFNCSLSFQAPSTNIPKFRNFIEGFHPRTKPEDMLLQEIWKSVFHCLSEDKISNLWFEHVYNISLHVCNGTESLTDIKHFFNGGYAHKVYQAVHAVAAALHDMLGFMNVSFRNLHEDKHQLFRYLQANIYLSDKVLLEYFNDNQGQFIIQNHVLINNTLLNYNVGFLKENNSTGQHVFINTSLIKWKNDQKKVPKSQCSEDCPPGNRQVPSSNLNNCCYSCVPCSEGEISNETGSDDCLKCPDHEWPNENKTHCDIKMMEFLSYTSDTISLFFISISVILYFITCITIFIFILYVDTPIVIANNRNLSFVLLLSIMMGFLSVFLFLGRPVDITCLLRQVSFEIPFTIAISSVLAKTTMVCIAFKATKPSSPWKKWIGNTLPNFIVIFFSSVQVLIFLSWLTISPPFLELDMYSYKNKIIVQCNKGSVVGFYSALGYMGLLAAVSFVAAFLARTLPDSFNDTKYITFSMLVFCSVWIAMIPAYLSTKGKYIVAVEIFAILASNTGLLGIFLPKCFIILFHPYLNAKKHLLNRYQ
ncbi:vomeronasal type-2 receptor 26-like [Gastrophryne carolinensis]